MGRPSSSSPSATGTSRLAIVPVVVHVGAAPELRLAAGDSASLAVPRSPGLEVDWHAISPRPGVGRAAGNDLCRSETIDSRRRGVRVTASADSAAGAVFMPYVTNATGMPLTFIIDAGSEAEASCH
jgi:hypothetical protein